MEPKPRAQPGANEVVAATASDATVTQTIPAEANPVSRAGKYRITGRIGQGGMGVVYRAVDDDLGRTVALKFIPPELAANPTAEQRFLREARAASVLDHPNIGTIFGVEETNDRRRFIVMAYYEGRNLRQRIDDEANPLTPREALAIGVQVAGGLAEAHAHGVIHRDIKPSNILLTTQGLVKIVDFGLAAMSGADHLTHTGASIGTPAYMSPEQALGGEVDHRSDIWSLGVMICEMLTRQKVFMGGSAMALLYQVVHENAAALGALAPEPRAVLTKALMKDPAQRYQSMNEFRDALESLNTSESFNAGSRLNSGALTAPLPRTKPRTKPWTKRRYRLFLLAAVSVIALAAALLTLKNSHGVKPAAYQAYLAAVPYLQGYEKTENLNKAIEKLKQATQADPGFALAFAALGDAYTRKFDLTQDRSLLLQAESNASHALELNDSLARVHVVMGEVHKAFGRRDLAQQEFLSASKLEPNDADALSGLAGEYVASQRIQDAERLYRQAVALRPDSWDVYNNFGRFLMEQEKPEEAADQFRMVIQRAPDNVAGYQNLAAALLQAGRLEEAEAPLRRAVGLDDSSWAVHINLGDLYFRRGLLPQAEKETLRGIELNDKYWENWVNLAVIYRWWGRNDRAISAYRRAIPLIEELLTLQDKDAAIWAELAEMHAYLGDLPKSSSEMQKAMALDPENPLVLLSSADTHEALGEHRLAIELANKAVANGLRLASLDTDPEARKFRADPDFRRPGR